MMCLKVPRHDVPLFATLPKFNTQIPKMMVFVQMYLLSTIAFWGRFFPWGNFLVFFLDLESLKCTSLRHSGEV